MRISSALAGIRGVAPVDDALRRLRLFPQRAAPRVFWAGIEAGPALAHWPPPIEATLEPLGIPREKREFQPHITLARLDSLEGLDASARRRRRTLALAEFGRTAAKQFYLYQSVLKRRAPSILGWQLILSSETSRLDRPVRSVSERALDASLSLQSPLAPSVPHSPYFSVPG